MKFQDYLYKRINIDEIRTQVQGFVNELEQAETFQCFSAAFAAVSDVFAHVWTMGTLNQIRFTINTKDEFLSGEKAFWDQAGPLVEEMKANVIKAILKSPFKEELRENVPETLFLKSEYALRAFDEKIIPDLQEENRLQSEYDKLIAAAQIEFNGKTLTLAALMADMENHDEKTRKAAYEAYWGYMEEHEATIDDIFDQLVKVRDKIAKTLGFNTFTELGYIRMNRFGYHEKEVATYRQEVLKDVVPVAQKLYEAQKKRLGWDTLEGFNEKFLFKTGNPTPKHDKDEMVKIAQKMYHELSPATGEFFDFMVERDLLDLEAKPGKAAGGYCTYLPDFESPFIFSNFNGTSGDVDVLTHEAGHAFQVYSSRWIRPIDCMFTSSETAEIHSMSMEFFAWPWMKEFFGEDAEKYFYYHLASTVQFLPYGVLVDHFQHEVYNNVNMTPGERKDTWRRLEKQYLPHKNYESLPFLDKGTWWFRQLHIFGYPFYYIDYTLAQVVALQFWLRLQQKDEQAFEDYHTICKLGGSRIFTDIIEIANLKSPFVEGCLRDVMKLINGYLSSIDDVALDTAE